MEARERQRNSRLAREVELALPAELTPTQAAGLARAYVLDAFVAEGMVADVTAHWVLREHGRPKPHAHVLLTTRRIAADGFGPKEREWNSRTALVRWRTLWAEAVNACLAAHGHPARLDHRSHAARGLDLEPQNKIGQHAARRARRGEASERVAEHRMIAERNAARRAGGDRP